MHDLLVASHGLSCYQVAEWLGQHRRRVERWVHQFGTQGFAGLQESDRPSRLPRLTARQLAAVGRALPPPSISSHNIRSASNNTVRGKETRS